MTCSSPLCDNTLTPSALLDRRAIARRSDAGLRELATRAGTRFVPVWRGLNLFKNTDDFQPVYLPHGEAKILLDSGGVCAFLGEHGATAYFSIELPDEEDATAKLVASGAQFRDLRRAMSILNGLDAEVLAHAKALFDWHASHRYCGSCGAPTITKEGGHLLVCSNPHCEKEHFPRTDPAIITVVTNGDRCLLGRHASWPEGNYSTLAGFVEPGETLESAVAREVFEETGIRIKNSTYRASQPWPFPCSIMLGFASQAEDGKEGEEITVDQHELSEAHWFTRDQIKTGLADKTLGLPPNPSIAYRLIEEWYDSAGQGTLAEIFQSNWTVR
jgi:NAD+ diphosphatase